MDRLIDVGEGYRIPKLEEFVQGFQFEVAKDISMGFIDHVDDPDGAVFQAQLVLNKKRFWRPCIVWWKHDPKEKIVEEVNGYTVHTSGTFQNFFKPFDEQSFIDQGLVRVKI